MKHLALFILVIHCFLFSSYSRSADKLIRPIEQPIHVVFLVPEPEGVEFWDLMLTVMKAAQKDLNIELEVIHFSDVDYPYNKIIKRLEDVTKRKNKPDYIISYLYLDFERQILDIIEKNKVNYFSINSFIPLSLFNKLGKPREQYRYWLGHISPNDIRVGEMLTLYLFKTAKVRKKQKNIRLLAIAAQQNNLVSEHRRTGLMQAVNRQPEINLVDLVYSDWLSASAEIKAKALLAKHQNISIFWNVSIGTAIGTIQAIKQQPLTLGKDIFVGGIDWTVQAINAIKGGEMEVSFGGHFLDGAKVLILLYDHFHGADFIDKIGPVIETKLRAINKQNVLFFEAKLTNPQWHKLNFKKFSLFENKSASRYNFETEYFFKF